MFDLDAAIEEAVADRFAGCPLEGLALGTKLGMWQGRRFPACRQRRLSMLRPVSALATLAVHAPSGKGLTGAIERLDGVDQRATIGAGCGEETSEARYGGVEGGTLGSREQIRVRCECALRRIEDARRIDARFEQCARGHVG